MGLSLSAVPRKNPNIVARVIGEEIILVPIFKSSDEMSCIYSLDKSASSVWRKLNGKNNIAGIKEQLLREFDSSSQDIDRQLEIFLRDLEKSGVICYKKEA